MRKIDKIIETYSLNRHSVFLLNSLCYKINHNLYKTITVLLHSIFLVDCTIYGKTVPDPQP